MREIRPSGSEGGAGFYPSFLPLSHFNCIAPAQERTNFYSTAPEARRNLALIAIRDQRCARARGGQKETKQKSGKERKHMFYVMIRHKVANYAKWKRVVKSAAKWRKASGEKCFYVCRSSKNSNDLLVWCEWDTAARAKKFIHSADLRKRMKEAGIVGKPEVSFYNKMEDLSAK